jgi:hypothetical protein
MIPLIKRSATFIPSEPVLFPKDGLKLLYTYEGYKDDKKIMKYVLAASFTTSLLWGVEALMTKKIANIFFGPFKIAIFASLYPLVFLKLNNTRILQLYLDQSGEHFKAVVDGDLKKGLMTVRNEDAIWTKDGEHFVLTVEGKKFFLDQDGKILDLQLFYAVVRSMSVDKEFIKLEA